MRLYIDLTEAELAALKSGTRWGNQFGIHVDLSLVVLDKVRDAAKALAVLPESIEAWSQEFDRRHQEQQASLHGSGPAYCAEGLG